MISVLPEGGEVEHLKENYDFIIDSIFGYSFQGEIREPFKTILPQLKASQVPIASVDIPSGWDVEEGNIQDTLQPEMLISLTAPKKGAENFQGAHYVGGRFVPDWLFEKFECEKPLYKGSDQFARL
jgi:NAD(P)H-hydrate epimerase